MEHAAKELKENQSFMRAAMERVADRRPSVHSIVAGWEPRRDESGREYWFNLATNNTQWSRPNPGGATAHGVVDGWEQVRRRLRCLCRCLRCLYRCLRCLCRCPRCLRRCLRCARCLPLISIVHRPPHPPALDGRWLRILVQHHTRDDSVAPA